MGKLQKQMKRGESQGLNLGTQSSLELCLSSFPFISAWHCFPLLLIHSLHIMDMAARNSKLLLLSSMFQLYVAVLQAPQTWWLNTTTIITILTYYLGRTLVVSLCGISLGGSKTTYGFLRAETRNIWATPCSLVWWLLLAVGWDLSWGWPCHVAA